MDKIIYAKALEERKLMGKKPTNGVCRYSFIDSDATIHDPAYTACHAGMNRAYYKRPDKKKFAPKAVVNKIMPLLVSEEAAFAFYEWMLNYSPYADVWRSKSPRGVLRDGAAIARTDVPSNLLVGALIATRSLSEEYSKNYMIGQTWYDLVSRGVHPNIAFPAAHTFGKNANGAFYWANWCSHTTIHGNEFNTIVLNFYNNTPIDLGEIWEKCLSFGSSNDVWMKVHKKTPNFHSLATEALANAKLVVKSDKVNPFVTATKPTVAKKWNYEETMEVLVPLFKKTYQTGDTKND